ncbi:XdhC family protein [uncultured Psychrobacter sp.]|uniref:XdhC family protein n=1 Tax=uncultured Psychrobacter sp. TaxID=259303 RepID=UPI00263A2543|nr:XdhC/CoxI family protein [uncultured Psychrobacter sp.]
MNQIADILKLASDAQKQAIDAVLATVVRTEGSAYRRAGAMMLILEDGRSVGMISGGCLEPHIIKRAFWLTRHGACVQAYQTGDDIGYTEDGRAKPDIELTQNDVSDDPHDDLYHEMDELNFGLGCNGRVHILFERLTSATALLDIVRQVRATQQPKKIATLIRFANHQDSSSKLKIGMRLDLDNYTESGQITTIGTDNSGINNESNQAGANTSSTIVDTVKKLAQHALIDKNAKYIVVKDDDNDNDHDNANLATEWLVQNIQPQIRLLICGAGDDVLALVTMAKLQDWHVTVVDSRPGYATRLRFFQADRVMQLPLDATDKLLALSENAAVALMSHSLSQDRIRLATLLEHAHHYKYLGQLGPRYRTERLINEISATKADPSVLNAGINKLHYPIGYKLGGDGPEALALSIMAQINAVMHGQTPSAQCVDLANSDITMMSHA